jgi:hypothetical protein
MQTTDADAGTTDGATGMMRRQRTTKMGKRRARQEAGGL